MAREPLTPWLVMQLYRQGAFAMGDGKEGATDFYTTSMRALIPIDGIRVSRSLRKVVNQVDVVAEPDPDSGRLCVTFDRAFDQVIRGCQREEYVWINEEIIRIWNLLHYEGFGHSCEVWRQGELVGGVYGVAVGGCFCGESMFHKETNASKVALYFMVEKVRSLGFEIFDAQFINEHTRSLGAYEIPQKEYLARLRSLEHKQIVWG